MFTSSGHRMGVTFLNWHHNNRPFLYSKCAKMPSLNWMNNCYCYSRLVVYSYAESAARLLYQIYCELVLPVPAELEHLRSPDSNDNDRSVPLPSVTAAMSYQSSSADVGQTQTARHHPRYDTVNLTKFPSANWLSTKRSGSRSLLFCEWFYCRVPAGWPHCHQQNVVVESDISNCGT